MNVLITGAAGGLGRAFAAACAAMGFTLMLTDRSEAALKQVAGGMARRYGVPVFTHACDLTKEEEVAGLARAVQVRKEAEGGMALDMLINVAGFDHEGGFLEQDFACAREILQVNIEATLRVTHTMLALRRGTAPFHIIFVSSLAALYPMPLKAAYAASKRFLLDFSLALGQELKRDGVSVLSLCPAGLPTTPTSEAAIAAQGFWGAVTTNRMEIMTRRTIRRALAGRRLYIPGGINRVFSVAVRAFPAGLVARILHARWNKAQARWLRPSASGGKAQALRF